MVNLAIEPPVPVSPRMASSFEQDKKIKRISGIIWKMFFLMMIVLVTGVQCDYWYRKYRSATDPYYFTQATITVFSGRLLEE